MSGPLISVIIPTFNRASLVGEAVESALAQDWPDKEIIVVDDGSTDDTRERLRPFAEQENFHYIRQENAGAAAARQRGLEKSRGGWVAFLDSDDIFLPGHLRSHAEALLAHPEADFSYGPHYQQDFQSPRRLEGPLNPPRDSLLDALAAGLSLGIQAGLFRRDAVLKMGGMDARWRIPSETFEFWLRAAGNCRGVHVPVPTSLVRRHADSWSLDEAAALAACRLAMEHHGTKTRLLDIHAPAVRRRMAFLNYVEAQHLLAAGRGDEARGRLRESLRLRPLQVKARLSLMAASLFPRCYIHLLQLAKRSRGKA